jgi:hypothetical protein
MASSVGWRNFWWLNTALLGFTAICCIFLFPETRFNRDFALTATPISLSPTLQSRAEVIDQSPVYNDSGTVATEHIDSSKGATVSAEHSGIADNCKNIIHVHKHQDPWLGRGRPSKSQWKIAQPYEGNIFLEFVLPWKLCLFPIVEFSAFVVSWSASSFLTLNLTQSQAFAAPPYSFSSTKIGFFNFAIFIGALIGLVTAGPLSDTVAARLTKRNRGIREPEMRLLAMIPYVIIMIIGNVVVAIGYERAWDWKVCFGFACLPQSPVLTPCIGYCNNRLHMCRHPSVCSALYILDLLR